MLEHHANPQIAGFGWIFDLTDWPFHLIWPSSGLVTPKMIFINVDLPAPFSPKIAWISPGWITKSTPSFAVSAPYRLVMPVNSNNGEEDWGFVILLC